MFGNGRKTIGVYVTQIHLEYQDKVSRGICERAKELGYNVAFFTNYMGYGEKQYEIGENSVADLPKYEDFDGIILMPDTMYVEGFEQKIRDNIKKFSKCPVISIRQKIDEFYNILINDDLVLEEIIRHFIEKHGFRKINFLAGPVDNPASNARLASYKRILTQYNIPFNEDNIYYGDFWKFKSKDAVKKWLSDPNNHPEAIICGNDFMAIALINELTERGISVPEDIAVSGCDNIMIAENYSPSITTASIPFYGIGKEAVDVIHNHNQGIPQEKNTYINAVTKIRESCGCKLTIIEDEIPEHRNLIINELEEKDKAISNNAFMSVELTNIETIEELDHKLSSLVYSNEGLSSFYMCLNKNWCFLNTDSMEEKPDMEHMIMEIGIRKGEWLDKTEFLKSSLLPPVHKDPEPQVFFFNILHYQEICFGYTAISFTGNHVHKPSYLGWLINVCNALENIRIHNELNRLVYKLEDMYIKDELTDLYNRRALTILGQKYLRQCIEENSKLMVFTADMDKLKYINDNFGHACGDIAIKVVAEALKYAAEDDEICMRIGGDEFVVIGVDYNQKKMDNFLEKFEKHIDRFNNEAGNEYKVYVSYGWSIINPNKFISIEDCLIVVDAKMYQQKYEKETFRLKQRSEFREKEEK